MRSKYSYIRLKAKALVERNKKITDSFSYRKVVGLLSGLGFLIAPGITPYPNSKVEFEEAFHIALNADPRILEILPAAVISFPKSFLHFDKAPEQFKQLVAALKAGKNGPDFHGIKFEKYYEAADRVVKNAKRKVISERRIPKTFRLRPAVIKAMDYHSKKQGLNYTAYLENLILSNQDI